MCATPPLHSRHELVNELVVRVAAHALVLAADIERAPQQLLIVRACGGTRSAAALLNTNMQKPSATPSIQARVTRARNNMHFCVWQRHKKAAEDRQQG